MDGLDLDELVDAGGILAPGEEACRGAGVGGAGVRIAELGCEELEVAPGGLRAVVVDEGGKEGAAGCVQESVGRARGVVASLALGPVSLRAG